jgi:hypothetical protein
MSHEFKPGALRIPATVAAKPAGGLRYKIS